MTAIFQVICVSICARECFGHY